MIPYKVATKLETTTEKFPFVLRASAAVGVSVVADVLDYVAAPIFATPIIGDIADVFVSGLLFSLTRSKRSTLLNAIEFIPVIGDLVPTYTISTLLWIRKETSKRNNTH
jgi:hypothetical protein